MAGRGTDIQLGGKIDFIDDKKLNNENEKKQLLESQIKKIGL